jgi:starch synthase
VQFVALGVGELRYQKFLLRAQERYGTKVAVDLSFNSDLAHLIEAGSDMFLMASRYEPCGLNQMYSLRYGTIPIVRATGGLDDTIDEFDPSTGKGTGFKFTKYGSSELLTAIRRAIGAYANPGQWKKLMRNGMMKDFTWESSARKYVKLYRGLAGA